MGWCCDVMVSRPTTAAKSRNRSVSASVALDGGRSGIRPARAGTSRDEFGPVGLDVGQELILGGVGDVVAERFGEQLVGSGEVLFAMAEQHAGPVVEGGSGRLGHQGASCPDPPRPRPAGPRGPPPAATRLTASVIVCHLGLAADHSDCGAHGQATQGAGWTVRRVASEGLPNDLDGLDRVGQALEGQLPE